MGLTVNPFPFGATDIGKSALIDFLTTGKRPEPSHSTAFYVPFSESIVFYRRDWERISKKMFGEVVPDFVDFMMTDAIPKDQPELKKAYLASCNRGAKDDDAKILDLDKDYTVVSFSGPDTGGQKRYEEILYDVATFCRGYLLFPCFRYISEKEWPNQFDDLRHKMKIVDEQLGSDYEWKGAYIQLQIDRDEKIPEPQIKELKSLKDLPIYHVSALNTNRYDIVDIFVIQTLMASPLVTPK